jgi:hypothetical protein
VIATACATQCTAQSGLSCNWPSQNYDCLTEVCLDPVTPTGTAPTAEGCEDGYVAMTLCLAGLAANQWECSDQGGVLWPAPVAGTDCEPAVCAWTCCERVGGGLLYDLNILARCNCA